MCALCGVLGAAHHWTDAAPRPGVFTRNTDTIARRRERAARVARINLVLQLYGLSLSDWQGSAYLLSAATGRTEIVDNLSHLWSTAEAMLGRACDPLEPALINRLAAARG